MELSPQAVAAATFKTVKRGYDPDEVRAYLIEVSASLEASHQQATAMEARARAAIAKLQDATQNAQATGPVPVVHATPSVGIEDAEAISRTLLLAQRTADSTIAEAKAEASTITESAKSEAAGVTASAKREAAAALELSRAEAARVLDEARTEALRAKSEQHLRAEAEVRDLQARREGLLADVDSLERHVVSQRGRLREMAEALAGLAGDAADDPERPKLEVPIAAADGFGASGSSSVAPAALAARSTDTGERPVSNGMHTGSHLLAPPAGSVTDGPVTGQVPLQPGVEPLVSPRPTSADEVRSMWAEADRADRVGAEAAGAAGAAEAAEAVEADGVAGEMDATPVEGVSIGADDATPGEGILR